MLRQLPLTSPSLGTVINHTINSKRIIGLAAAAKVATPNNGGGAAAATIATEVGRPRSTQRILMLIKIANRE